VTDDERKSDLSILEGAWVRGATAGGCDKFQGRIILDSNNRASKCFYNVKRWKSVTDNISVNDKRLTTKQKQYTIIIY